MIRAALILVIFIVLILLFNQYRGPAKQRANRKKLEEIVEDASIDPKQTRTAIIRLRQIVEPEQMKLAISTATLLEELLTSLESTNKQQEEQEAQEQENLTLSRTTSELEEKQQLANAPRLRSEFLSRMGDEITSPMNSLKTMLTLLNEMEFEPQARDLLLLASHSAHSLIENLTNILEFSKLDANLLTLQKQHLQTNEAISSVIETQESIALSKSLLIETDIKLDVPDIIFCDEKAFSKVLDNLISNAIRFTDKGHIKLTVDYKSTKQKKLLRFIVSDTGVGIPEKALQSLFDSLDKDTELNNSSFTGRLRLIVSKQLCELMGGEIGVRSKEGVGSQFWFTIDISE